MRFAAKHFSQNSTHEREERKKNLGLSSWTFTFHPSAGWTNEQIVKNQYVQSIGEIFLVSNWVICGRRPERRPHKRAIEENIYCKEWKLSLLYWSSVQMLIIIYCVQLLDNGSRAGWGDHFEEYFQIQYKMESVS